MCFWMHCHRNMQIWEAIARLEKNGWTIRAFQHYPYNELPTVHCWLMDRWGINVDVPSVQKFLLETGMVDDAGAFTTAGLLESLSRDYLVGML